MPEESTDVLRSRMKLPFCRLIIEAAPLDGHWNMAVDAALLESAVHANFATLRWYQWREPTISLGYFQSLDAPEQFPQLAPLPRVRRLTGGGAILHDREWTYSCVLPPGQTLVAHPYHLYDLIHLGVVDWFREHLSIELGPRGVTEHQTPEPFLCFARRDSHDICHQGNKVLGSAQRRRKQALLQHGSLVLRHSSVVPEVLGLADMSPSSETLLHEQLRDEHGESLARWLASLMGFEVVAGELTVAERHLATELFEASKIAISEERLRCKRATEGIPSYNRENPNSCC